MQAFKQLMKADACDYGDGTALARKGSKRPPAAAEETEDAEEGLPGHALGNESLMDATPAAVNGHGRFEHLGNGDSTAGIAYRSLQSDSRSDHPKSCLKEVLVFKHVILRECLQLL